MKTTTTLGPRPAPSEISFDRSCFVQDGFETVYAFGYVPGSIGGGKTFTRIEDAQDWARRTGRSFAVQQNPVLRRVSWR